MKKNKTISPRVFRTQLRYSLFLCILMLFLCSFVWGQNYFKTPGGIPHLPVLSTAPTENLSSGLMYINSTDNILYWYNGSQWVSVGTFGVTTSVSGTATNAGYFGVKGGNPVIPVLAAAPTGIAAGAVYFNSSDSNFYWYNGSSWMVVGGMVLASDVSFTTDTVCPVGTSYTATYDLTYSDNISASTCAESGTTFQWYRADDATGTNQTAISGATSSSYTVAEADSGYYIAVALTPQTACGAVSSEAFSPWVLARFLTAPDGTIVETITSPSGRVWMDRNLGAPNAAASSTDYTAYGSLFQWCRAADGHELMTWTSSSAGTPVNGTTSTLSSSATPGHSLFIIPPSGSYDWLSSSQGDGSLWWNSNDSTVGTNSPCPDGYHVPSQTEWSTEDDAGISSQQIAYQQLKFPATGSRSYSTGDIAYSALNSFYWTSTMSSTTKAYNATLAFEAVWLQGAYKTYGYSIRCIQDE